MDEARTKYFEKVSNMFQEKKEKKVNLEAQLAEIQQSLDLLQNMIQVGQQAANSPLFLEMIVANKFDEKIEEKKMPITWENSTTLAVSNNSLTAGAAGAEWRTILSSTPIRPHGIKSFTVRIDQVVGSRGSYIMIGIGTSTAPRNTRIQGNHGLVYNSNSEWHGISTDFLSGGNFLMNVDDSIKFELDFDTKKALIYQNNTLKGEASFATIANQQLFWCACLHTSSKVTIVNQ